ncbi:MAG: N-acetyltransferase [Pseudomonadota bacterium]
MLSLRFEYATDGSSIEELLDLSFGVNRHAKVSYRYRDGVEALPELGFVAEFEHRLVGAIRYWPMLLDDMPVLLLGPLAIHPDHKNTGIGRALVTRSLGAAAERGDDHVFLVGEHAYYRRFGFMIAPPAIIMPGERPERLHWLGLRGVTEPPAGGTLRSWGCLRRSAAAPRTLALTRPVMSEASATAPVWAS